MIPPAPSGNDPMDGSWSARKLLVASAMSVTPIARSERSDICLPVDEAMRYVIAAMRISQTPKPRVK